MNKLTSGEIVKKEVDRQAEFGMEPSWEDFVIAGMDETKAQLAHPDREKIAKWLFKDCLHPTSKIDWVNKWKALSEQDKEYWLEKADQIKALYPDEEDELKVVGLIRKQERERIIATLVGWHDSGTHLISAETIQALEEDEK